MGSCIRLFADDTSLFIIVNASISSAERLNADLVKILQWTETWQVTINPNKTEPPIIYLLKQTRPSTLPLYE